jgi:hypothetical protein
MKCLFPANKKIYYFDVMEIDADETFRRMQAMYERIQKGDLRCGAQHSSAKADDDADSNAWTFPSLNAPSSQNPCIEIDPRTLPNTAEEWKELVGGIIPEYVYGMQEDDGDEWLDALSGALDFELEETTSPGRPIPKMPSVKVVPPTKEYPHKCLTCGSKAYIGFSNTDCSNKSCGNYRG